jgi:hypothetical protein
MSRASKSRKEKCLKDREAGFDLDLCNKLPEYNALLDSNMRHYFENEIVQAHLIHSGQIDRFGRIITLDHHRLRVIENAIARAEEFEQRLEKEEDNMRHAIQHKRSREIDRRRDLESVARRREEKMLSFSRQC